MTLIFSFSLRELLPGWCRQPEGGQRWVVPMRVTPVTIRTRLGARSQSWCLEWDTVSGQTPWALSGTPKRRASPAPGTRTVGRMSRGSGDPWMRSWCGRRMSASGWHNKIQTCTMRSWAKCWVRQYNYKVGLIDFVSLLFHDIYKDQCVFLSYFIFFKYTWRNP